ncbi:HEAT repeat domain-containing protein [Nocardioides sp. Root151]|uniref:HEAT repeat domain-containing protein n=1 Tax=Nocardioides sp. Root151 TaxID=1736475 RepID=UPI000702E097|nr:HEAT repeat domain-containing protein [Nocardioides sp. Root151]KQZ66371.1 hypothetical protein ASD66_22825 [Nocardioides sp. Root151]
MTLLIGLVVALLVAAVLLVVLLLALRVTSGLRTVRHTREHEATRGLVFELVLGDPEDSARARRELAALQGGEWDRAEHQVFSLLPKVSGDTRERLVELVRQRNAADRARRLLRRRSSVARCRGAHRLGALRDPVDVAALTGCLHDRHFLVRRVALRALGSIGDPAAVPAILATSDDPALTRDVVSALQRIGIDAAPDLRGCVEEGLRSAPGRATELAVIALGLIGDAAAVPVLTRALDCVDEGVQAEAAIALGLIGAPRAIGSLIARLDTDSDRVRRAAARALGEIGDPKAADGLGSALSSSPRLTARALAGALLRLGEAGRRVLQEHASPYAREALAVDALRKAAR